MLLGVSGPPQTRRRSWTSSRRSPGPAAATRPWLRRSGASAGRRVPHASSATWRCRSALARCTALIDVGALRSVYNCSAVSQETPIAPPDSSKPARLGRCTILSSLGAFGAQTSLLHASPRRRRQAPARSLARLAMAASRQGGCLAACLQARKNATGALMALARVEPSPPHPSQPPKAGPGRGQLNSH